MHPVSGAVLVNDEEREEIRQQLNRMVESHHFRNSRRYPALLKFIVEEALEGRSESLRERPLGVHVFDRPADYDTASDPIVRVTVAEIRKRIAQYYHDEEHDAEVRIELLPGRYTPEFHFRNLGMGVHADGRPPVNHSAESRPEPAGSPQSNASPADSVVDKRRPGLIRRYWVAAMILFLVCPIAAISIVRWLRPSPLEEMWGPFLKSSSPILFCIPTGAGKKAGPLVANSLPTASSQNGESKDAASTVPSFLVYESRGENVVYSDMLGTLSIANVLAAHHHDYHTKLNETTDLDDLRHGPAVLIGGMDNQWTMLALAPLRFHFAGNDEIGFWITDQENPGNRQWILDLKEQYVSVMRDYAIVARLHNKETGQPEMIVAGIGMSGTAAAGEYVADEKRMEDLRRLLGPNFKNRDFEVVLSTDVVNGIAGSPTVAALTIL
jgi:hypothetical protein